MEKGNVHFLHDDNASFLEVAAARSGDLIVKILDVQGRMAKTIIEKVEQGVQELCVNLNDLGSGYYVLNTFIGDTFIKAFRFFKS